MLLSDEVDLAFDLVGSPAAGGFDAACVEPRPDVAVLWILAHPPSEEREEGLLRGVDFPVELWGDVVHPAFAEPEACVGVEAEVCIESFDTGGVIGSVDAERADADKGVGAPGLDEGVEVLHEGIDVVSTPGGAVRESVLAEAFPGGVVGEWHTLLGIGVEIIVDVDAVERVASEEVIDDGERVRAGVGLSRVEPDEIGERLGEVGSAGRDVIGCQGRFGLGMAGAEGVDPGVKLDSRGMAPVEPGLERVVLGRRGGAGRSGDELGPGFQGARVDGVGGGADLEDNRVEVERAGPLDDGVDFGELSVSAEVFGRRPVDVGDGGDPSGAELGGDGSRSGVGRSCGGTPTTGRGAACE